MKQKGGGRETNYLLSEKDNFPLLNYGFDICSIGRMLAEMLRANSLFLNGLCDVRLQYHSSDVFLPEIMI